MSIISKNAEGASRGGLVATYNSGLTTTDTYTVPNDGKTVLHFKKAGAGACTVTIIVNDTVDGLAVPNRTVVIPATTGDKFVGPFPHGVYGDPVSFTFSEVTGLTFAAVRVG